MNLLQVKINDQLKTAIDKKAEMYGVPSSSLVRIVLVKSFLKQENEDEIEYGNVFNARRDNNGKGIPIDDVIGLL